MGSYDVACGVSRITLHPGDPVVFIPFTCLKEKMPTGAYIVSNAGPKHSYTPLTLPLFGEYGDYGRIDVTEDVNTGLIEKYFDVDTFAEQASTGKESETGKIPDAIAGMFIRREIYDHLVKNPHTEFRGISTAYNDHYVTGHLLKHLGFIEGQEDKTRVRYNVPYAHPKLPKLLIWSDGQYIEAYYNDELIRGIYNIEALCKVLKQKKQNIPQNFLALQKFTPAWFEYEENLIELQETLITNEMLLEGLKKSAAKETDPEKKKKLDAIILNSPIENYTGIYFHSNHDWWFNNKNDHFYNIYKNNLADLNVKNLFVNFKTFDIQLYHVNAAYSPTWNGMQCGDDVAQLELSKAITKLMTKQVKTRK